MHVSLHRLTRKRHISILWKTNLFGNDEQARTLCDLASGPRGGAAVTCSGFGGLNAHSQGQENNLVNPRHHESRRERISARPTRDNPRFSQKSDRKQTNKKELTWGQIFAKVVKRKGEDSPASSSSMLQHHRLFMFPFRPELRPHLCWRSGSQRVEANRADKLDYYSSSHLCGNNIYTLMWL